ncbi:MAG: hypothetical protein UEX93_06880 [Peptococcaceae bacterium]|nr:hypothetical protein [Peptococcaceae bacterium]
MKIYNRKGFIWGIVWTVLGGLRLLLLVIQPEDTTAQLVKGIIVGVVLLTLGLSGFTRALSKQATREDRIEENDERNKLVRLKSKARVNDVMFWTMIALIVCGVIGYYMTDNIAWAFLAFAPLLQVIVYFWSSIILSIYYERRE